MTDLSKLQWRDPETIKDRYGVVLRNGVEVTSVDPQSKTVTVDGNEKVQYGKLILAVGSKPKVLPIDGVGLENVFTLRQVPDVEKINAGRRSRAPVAGSR